MSLQWCCSRASCTEATLAARKQSDANSLCQASLNLFLPQAMALSLQTACYMGVQVGGTCTDAALAVCMSHDATWPSWRVASWQSERDESQAEAMAPP